MIDFLLGLVLAGMLVRGWSRGFVRESLDLVGLVVGIWIAFRLSAPFGQFLTDSFDMAPEVARIGGGIVLFIPVGAMLSVAAHYLSKMMNLPGLSMVNRVGGAAVAVAWGVLIVLILVSLVSVVPVPASWRDRLEESRVADLIAGEDAVPRRLFESVAGDNVMSAMAAIRGLFGSPRAVPVGDEVLAIPPAADDEVRQVRDEAQEVLEDVNEHRVGVGLRALTPVGEITELAEEHANGLYRVGILQRLQDCAATLADRGYQALRCDNGVALAATASAGLRGIEETPEGIAMLETPDFDRAGAAVVDGPTGRLLVLILAG
jgi:membrane protein required for colicin V production